MPPALTWRLPYFISSCQRTPVRESCVINTTVELFFPSSYPRLAKNDLVFIRVSGVGVLNFVRITTQNLRVWSVGLSAANRSPTTYIIGERVNLPSHQGKNQLKIGLEGWYIWWWTDTRYLRGRREQAKGALMCYICQFHGINTSTMSA